RWFGYRPRYEDLCRLYTTRTLQRQYAEITATPVRRQGPCFYNTICRPTAAPAFCFRTLAGGT
ncbi:Z1 domain-containing protein, partial [Streptomyces sp. NPDC005568]|uniref:Z1 domain-containing protein n=1 Tax=Streptomyces sp. NPDC005568 TaxID=3156887 RepID=UPI0033BEC16B